MNTSGMSAGRWHALCDQLGLAAGNGVRQRFPDLERAYSEPQRHYHTAQHIGECLALLDGVAPQLDDAPLVELAIWLHDVVYAPGAIDNEAASARLARAWLQEALPSGRLDRLARWIEGTRTHEPAPAEPDLQALLDIDLAILAAPAARFAEYERQVRAEYAFVPEPVFAERRRAFLRELAAQPRLYGHPEFAHLEAAARSNLRAQL